MTARSVVIVTSEISGDHHASKLAREPLKLDPETWLSGMGGYNMHRAVVDILIDTSRLAVAGLAEGLAEVPANYSPISSM